MSNYHDQCQICGEGLPEPEERIWSREADNSEGWAYYKFYPGEDYPMPDNIEPPTISKRCVLTCKDCSWEEALEVARDEEHWN